MRSARRILLTAAALGGCGVGCASAHRVSPWIEGVRLDALETAATIDEQASSVRGELTRDSLSVDVERRGKFQDGEPFAILGASGVDEMGRPRHAVRVVTRHAVVLALGPAVATGEESRSRTCLVVSLASGGWYSGTDLNGDGLVDVVVRDEAGTFELWGVHARGASPYPMQGPAAPTFATDVNEDGMPEPSVRLHIRGADPIAPDVAEALVFEGGAYTAEARDVRSWHARQLRVTEERVAVGGGDGGAVATALSAELARAIERAWHELRAGRLPADVLSTLDATAQRLAPLEAGVAQAWVQWRGLLGDFANREHGAR